jgi:predicted RNA-binding protein
MLISSDPSLLFILEENLIQSLSSCVARDSIMCEFKVVLEEKTVFEDAIYIKDEGQRLFIRDILGQSKDFPGCHVVEISVEREELVIARQT